MGVGTWESGLGLGKGVEAPGVFGAVAKSEVILANDTGLDDDDMGGGC